MADRQAVQVPGLKAIGPYSHAVRAAGLLFVAGQPGVDPATGEVAGATLEEQARQAFKNLDMVLRAGGQPHGPGRKHDGPCRGYLSVRGGEPAFRGVFSRQSSSAHDHAGSIAKGVVDLDWMRGRTRRLKDIHDSAQTSPKLNGVCFPPPAASETAAPQHLCPLPQSPRWRSRRSQASIPVRPR